MTRPTLRIVLLTLWVALSPTASRAADPIRLSLTPEQRSALGIEVATPERAETIPSSALPARVAMSNRSHERITARLPGVLSTVHFVPGEIVEPTRILATIESPAYIELQRGLLEAVTQLDLARTTAERESALAAEGIVAGRRVIEAEARVTQAELLVEDHAESLRLAGVTDVELSRLRRTRSLVPKLAVRSAMTGPVLEQLVRPGERVAQGDPILRIADPDGLMLEIHAPVAVVNELRTGYAVEIDGIDSTAEVTSIGRDVDAQDQGVIVWARIVDPVPDVLPGRFVRARILTPIRSDAHSRSWSVPNTALVQDGEHDWIFVEEPEGFLPLSVVVRNRGSDRTIVEASLPDDREVAIRGTAALKAYWLESASGAD